MNIDSSRLHPFLTDLSKRAGDIAVSYFKTEQSRLGAKEKGTLDVVTEADLEIDSFLSHELKKAYPEIAILTEETAPKDFSHLKDSEYIWVVDPIDGTINFSRGDLNFCICIGLVSYGQPVAGIVFAPVRDEMYYADAQTGALCNDEKISVSSISSLDKTVICLDRGKQPEVFQATIDILQKSKGKILQVKLMGSAGLAMCFVAQGTIDGYYHKHLYPWDVAGPSAIARYAGAVFSSPNNGEWNVFNPTVLAANPGIHSYLQHLILS